MNKPAHFIAAILAATSVSACANGEYSAASATNDIMRAALQSGAATTAADRIEADVRYLADDARQGREAGTKGYDDAAAYVAARMEDIGLTSAGTEGWYQPVPLLAVTPEPGASFLSIRNQNGENTELTSLQDYRIFMSQRKQAVDFTAPVVFVGYGIDAPSEGHNDYEGLDVEGKIVAFLQGAPNHFETEKRAHYGSTSGKTKAASDRGAVGILNLYTSATEVRSPWERVMANPRAVRMTWLSPEGDAKVSGPNVEAFVTMNPSVSELLFTGAKQSYAQLRAEADASGGAPKGFALNVSVTVKAKQTAQTIASPNVVGMIEGADPKLRDEYVVLTAHLDHIGVNEALISQGKDGINNGAMDNALGIATLLEAARSLNETAPARSVLVVAVTAEEKALLGSEYFAHYPTVEKDAIVANVNLDMPIMFHDFTDVVAFGAERSTIGPIAKAALDEIGVKLSPDPLPEFGLFTRTDHYRFVQQGVPAVTLMLGFENGGEKEIRGFLAEHYHKPSDDLSLPINYESAARFAHINYLIAKGLATTKERPRWNEGDFFGDLYSE